MICKLEYICTHKNGYIWHKANTFLLYMRNSMAHICKLAPTLKNHPMKHIIFLIAVFSILGSCNQEKKKIKILPKKVISTIGKSRNHQDSSKKRDSNVESQEYKIHLKEIDTIIDYTDLFFDHKDTAWIKTISYGQYLKRYVLQKPSDLKYVSCLKLLPKLKIISCDSIKTKLKGKLKAGESVEIYLKNKKFNPKMHEIVYRRTELGEIAYTKSIDGQIPWGGEYGLPNYEIELLSVSINGKEVNIPKSAYQNFYDFNVCKDWGPSYRRVEGYTSIDGRFIYIYLEGGNAAGRYLAKLVFDKDKYLTRMVADHVDQAYASEFGQYPMNF
jgi:hypothetical protein